MAKALFVSCGAAAVGSLVVVAACVGGDATTSTTDPGALDGPCFANGTCSDGLVCGVVKGVATCVPPGDASSVDSSVADGSTADAAEAGPCLIKPTFYPCGGSNPPFACYGATQTCTATGCSGSGDLQWQCFSPNQCNSPCCIPANYGSVQAGPNCTQGALQLSPDDAGTYQGANCAVGSICPMGDVQLCQADSQCPAGQKCGPVKVNGGALSLNGVIVGACAP